MVNPVETSVALVDSQENLRPFKTKKELLQCPSTTSGTEGVARDLLADQIGGSPRTLLPRLKRRITRKLITVKNSLVEFVAKKENPKAKTKTSKECTAPVGITITYDQRPLEQWAIAIIVGTTAFGLAGFALVANISYVSSLGATGLSAVMLAALGATLEILALFLPALAGLSDKQGTIIAWILWLPAVVMVLISSCGFSSRYLDDGIFRRNQIVETHDERKALLVRLEAQLGDIRELRPVETIEAEITSAEFSPLWKRSHKCQSVTKTDSADLCKTIANLKADKADAEERERLQARIADLQQDLATAPAIASADPGSSTAAAIISWATLGGFTPSIHDLQLLRASILTIMPAMAGVLFALALRLTRKMTTV